MKNYFLLILTILLSFTAKAVNFTSSNLPIVVITTAGGVTIPDEPKVAATMQIVSHLDGSRNYLSDANNPSFLNYSGKIGIELRGSSSQYLDKKPYGLTTLKSDGITNNNVSILGMPSDNDWVLNSLAFDSLLVRDFLSYELSRNIGQYASRCVYCEVVVNNDYKGLYVFMEKLKIGSDRVNIAKMATTDIALPDLSGGYITKSDKTTGGDPIAWTMDSYSGSTDFLHESPKPADITTEQDNYIYNTFTAFETAMTSKNSSITNGYPSIIDIPTFVDFMIINEFSSNADAYQYSTYFHKDRGGKLRAGPIWDLNLTYGNDLGIWNLDRSHTDVWQFSNGDNTGAKFWKDLYDNATFRCYLSKRWTELQASNQPLNYAVISSRMDAIIALIKEASIREQARWGTVDISAGEIAKMKAWIQTRITWMNARLGNYSACSNPTLPPLVISKIHYNPLAVGAFSSNSLEFIEITNNSNQVVNLTGVYLRELGISYQFPANSTIGAYARIYIAGNSVNFQQFYGVAPFGQFSRSLSNKKENIVLADAFGNIIDNVEYQSSGEWSANANGTGSYLKLVDLNSDNTLALNWTTDNVVTSINEVIDQTGLAVYPNPAVRTVTISNKTPIQSYELVDLTGRTILGELNINSEIYTINVEGLLPNVYLLKISFTNGDCVVRKIVKL